MKNLEDPTRSISVSCLRLLAKLLFLSNDIADMLIGCRNRYPTAKWSKDVDHRPGSRQRVRRQESIEGIQKGTLPFPLAPFPRSSRPRQEFACNGTVVSSEDADEEGTPEPSNKAKQNFGQVIQLQGDQRAKIREFLISTGMVTERDAKEKIQVCV